ncbi:MAG: hypothetical protein OXC57_09920, partial [Rhodobacteraceae bacterium]|nr:hypothetical protein [Paracoccaceae bacterium]
MPFPCLNGLFFRFFPSGWVSCHPGPFVPRLFRYPWKRPVGTFPDAHSEDAPGHARHRPVDQVAGGRHEFLHVGGHNRQGVVEIHGPPLLSPFTSIGRKIVAGNGEQPGHGNRVEVGMRFPADIPFGLAMEAVDTDGRPGDLVQFLDGPALVVEVAD